MAAHRTQVAPEVLKAAYDASRSASDMAARLGVKHHTTAHRLARAGGLEIPAPHWGARAQLVEPADAEQVVQSDIALDRAQGDSTKYRALYKTARAALRSQQELLERVEAVAGQPTPPPAFSTPSRAPSHSPRREAVVHISDWQAGQRVSAVDTGGNEYDWSIMLSRMQRFLDGVVGSIANVGRAYEVTKVHLLYGGDMVEGLDIFAGQAYQLCKDAGAQVIDGAAAWSAWERELRGALGNEVAVARYGVPGNHGVPGGRRSGAVTSTVNYEYLWYELLASKGAELGIESHPFQTAGRELLTVAGHRVLLTHGDEVRGQMGIPFYGIRTGWMKHTQEVGPFRYWHFGHIHQTSLVTYGDGAALSNGDAVGANNMTGKLRNPTSTPQQTLAFYSDDRGLDELSYIHLTDKRPS